MLGILTNTSVIIAIMWGIPPLLAGVISVYWGVSIEETIMVLLATFLVAISWSLEATTLSKKIFPTHSSIGFLILIIVGNVIVIFVVPFIATLF